MTRNTPHPDPKPIDTFPGPVQATVTISGSKSITNRALVCAALATGTSTLNGALHADDTEAMVDSLRELGITIDTDWATGTLTVHGCAGTLTGRSATLNARLSGTTARFTIGLAALTDQPITITGDEGLRRRPMGPALDALRQLGKHITEHGTPGTLPVTITGPAATGGTIAVEGNTTSQHLSALMLAGPCMRNGLTIAVTTDTISVPYLNMTAQTMNTFGTTATTNGPIRIRHGNYNATTMTIPADASTASYPLAVAMLTGGTVTIDGLDAASTQGDIKILDIFEHLGGTIVGEPHRCSVTGPHSGHLRNITIDMGNMSDIAHTVAVVAAHGHGPSHISGIGFIRAKETDRIGNVVTELRRAGIDATEHTDGYTIRPAPIRPTTISTYGDHRMAMAFALLGINTAGISIADPGCVNKSYPGYWTLLDQLRASATT